MFTFKLNSAYLLLFWRKKISQKIRNPEFYFLKNHEKIRETLFTFSFRFDEIFFHKKNLKIPNFNFKKIREILFTFKQHNTELPSIWRILLHILIMIFLF